MLDMFIKIRHAFKPLVFKISAIYKMTFFNNFSRWAEDGKPVGCGNLICTRNGLSLVASFKKVQDIGGIVEDAMKVGFEIHCRSNATLILNPLCRCIFKYWHTEVNHALTIGFTDIFSPFCKNDDQTEMP